MKTLIFLPTFNERDSIVKLIEEIRKIVASVFILVVDDSSFDGTAELLDELARKELVYTAKTPAEFGEKLKIALKDDSQRNRSARIVEAKKNDWKIRIKQYLEFI